MHIQERNLSKLDCLPSEQGFFFFKWIRLGVSLSFRLDTGYKGLVCRTEEKECAKCVSLVIVLKISVPPHPLNPFIYVSFKTTVLNMKRLNQTESPISWFCVFFVSKGIPFWLLFHILTESQTRQMRGSNLYYKQLQHIVRCHTNVQLKNTALSMHRIRVHQEEITIDRDGARRELGGSVETLLWFKMPF